MRVLFITGEFPPMQGGVGACTLEIARALIALGVEVGVLTSTRAVGGQWSAVKVLPVIHHWGWSSWRNIAKTIREFAPDLAHIQYQTGAFGMHPAINLLPHLLPLFPSFPSHPRFVTTFHDLRVPYLFPKAGRVRDWVTRELARSSDAVIATNDEDCSNLETWNLKQLALIPIGSNVQTNLPTNYQRTAWRAQLGVREDESLLCYFGFLNQSKGGETLMRALARVLNAKLLMIGGQTGASDPTDVAYLAHVKALIAELGLTGRVLWTDFTPDDIVTANFRASDVCVLPYRDGASYRRGTLMAALAHGCAIVTTAVSRHSPVASMLPQLSDGENCLLVPPDDPVVLADAIQRALASSELRAKIGAGARELAQHFAWDKIARQHLDLYARMLGQAIS
ncbi:MAG: glycosyltransferase family 4 protein [Chloroflexi bacterium]|nr:glycosyltransferase family 4 protein [Chloroflexota bacterium]